MRLGIGAVVAAVVAATLSACTSGDSGSAGSLEVRPLIMPAQHATHARANPFGSLHVPSSEAAYSRMSRTQRADLAKALHGVNCAQPPTLTGTAARVVCDHESDVYLVGAPIVTADDVKKATPAPPSLENSSQWNVELLLDSDGADKMYRWTSRHHVADPIGAFNTLQTSSRPPCGAFLRTACSDFLVYVSDDVAVTVPVTFDAVQSAVRVSGDFDEQSATRFAHKIAG